MNATWLRRQFACLSVMVCAVATAPGAVSQTPGATTPTTRQTSASDVHSGIEGFRSARFGMKEAQVRAAIRADFGLADAAVKASQHPVERTRVLEIVVRDLVEGTGDGQIAYVLGQRSKALIQVNILWNAVGPAGADMVTGLANVLRNYFLTDDMRFKKETIARNVPTSDGRLVVFRGADDKQRAIELILAVAGPTSSRPAVRQLRLSYILSPDKPDAHSGAKGKSR